MATRRGPWQQQPDYTREVGSYTDPTTWSTRQGSRETISLGADPDNTLTAPYPAPAPETWVQNPATGSLTIGGGATGDSVVGGGRRNAPTGAFAVTTVTGVTSAIIFPFSAWGVDASSTRVNSLVPIPHAQWPEDALGVEYDGEPTVVGATWVYSATSTYADYSTGARQTVQGALPWRIIGYRNPTTDAGYFGPPATPDTLKFWNARLTVLGQASEVGDVVQLPAWPYGTVLTGEVDVTPYLWGGPRDGFLWLVSRYSGSSIPDPRDSRATNQLGVTLGYSTASMVRYLLRPPPHRFIFPVPKVLSPARVFPRDDGLLTASAARVWPPPRSLQGSSRIGPGSYY